MKNMCASRTLALITILLCPIFGAAQVSVLTHRYDVGRTGQNLNESVLKPSNVNVSNFGKLFFRTVDGYVYAQPLLVSGLDIQGQTRNVLFVATEHNSVYAFDADDPVANAPLWRVSLGTPVPSQDICAFTQSSGDGCNGQFWTDLTPEVGITGTPVIDSTGGTLYVVAKTKNASDSTYHFFLHALDLVTGAEKFAGPVEITIPSSSPVAFPPLAQLQRPGLLLLDGVVYIAFGSAGDFLTWHGWVMAYDSSTLQQLAYFNTTPSNSVFDSGGETGGGGIFATGGLLADSSNNIYFMSGNGPFDASTQFGVSALKLNTPQLAMQDYFTPHDASYLGANNVDLGSGGQLVIPGTQLLVGGGKDGVLRLIDGNNMGKFNASIDGNVQNLQVTNNWIFGSPVYWNGPNGKWIYLWTSGDTLKAWKFNGATLGTSPVSQNSVASPFGECDTSPMALSANQGQDGILWAPISLDGDPNAGTVPGILYAYDATNLATPLWSSQLNSIRDNAGNFAKFNPPTVANGNVYLPTFSGQVIAYGLNPPASTGIQFVQQATANPSSSSQVSQSFISAETAGDLNVIVVSAADPTSNVTSITDTQGNTYTLAVGPTRTANLSQWIYYAADVKAGTDTITAHFNQTANFPEIRMLEYAGADTTNPFDQAAGAVGTGSTPNSGSVTTTAPNEVIVGANTVATSTMAAGSPLIQRILTPNGDLAEDRTVNVIDTYNATAQLNTSGSWVMQVATFKAQSAGAADFSLAASPTSATVATGASVNVSVPVSGVNGFSGPVTLGCSGLPSGASCSFDPPSVSPDSNPATSTLTVSASSGTAAGTSPVTITGTSGSLSHSTSLSLTVQVGTTPDFTISADSPLAVSAAAGVASAIAIKAVNGFSAGVALACSGLPAGATCSFSPASVTGSGNSTMSIATTAATPVGSYAVAATGTSGAGSTRCCLTHSASVNLTVGAGGGGFQMSSPSPSSMTVTAGSSATFTTSITPSGGFLGTVNLTCSIATSASPAPACTATSVTISGATPVTATLTVTTTAPHASLRRSSSVFYAMLLPLAGITLLGASFGSSPKKKLTGVLLMLLLVSGLLFMAACGGGSSSGGGGGGTSGGTPAGTYTITVNGTSGSVSGQTTTTLTVQ